MMAYAFTLERVLLDYVPAAAVGCLILIEVLRLSGKGHIVWTIVITCIPGGLVLLAIDEQSVLSSGQWGLGLVAYPPVLLAGFGIAVAAVAYLRKSGGLWWIAAAYGMGVVLTYGFSPEDPYDLNYFGCCLVTSIILLGYGFIKRNPYICFAGIIVFCLGLPDLKGLPEMVKSWHLTEPGFYAGIIGLGTIALYLIFSKKLHQVLSVIGALALAVFVYDYLPASLSARYIIVLIGMVALLVGLWLRTRDVLVMVIITIPLWIRGYVLTKILANWRYIIFGFIALIGGACLSTLKKSLKTETSTEESNQQSDEITG
jgi:hypothetical protein